MADYDDLRVETERLILRVPRLEDLAAWSEMMADEETARHIGGVAPRAICWRQLMTVIGSWHALGFGMFAVLEKASGRWIGRVGPWQPDGWPGTEIGWSLVRDTWGKGYAGEPAAATMDWAIDTLGWTDIIHSIAPANVASQRVAEKLGSRNRGPGRLPPPYAEDAVEIWGQSADEWRERRAVRDQ